MSAAEYKHYFLVIAVILVGLTACNKPPNTAASTGGGDPADGNLAPVDSAQAPPAPAPGSSYSQPNSDQNNYPPAAGYDASYQQPLEAQDPPPPLPDYSQPPCPGDNYLWTPGYWDYASAGYYWVPGAWVLAPWVGALWTPAWWGFEDGAYRWHAGYWGPHIGFYGGINYGFGYTGRGYYGAYWNNNQVFYNSSVTTVNNAVVRNVYNYRVSDDRGNRVSYNGGRGGLTARPTAQEAAALRDPRTAPVPAQIQHAREASANRAQFASSGARPAALVAARPLATNYRAPAAHPPAAAMREAARPAETRAQVQPNQRPPAPVTRQEPAGNRPAPHPEARPVQPAPATRALTDQMQRPARPLPEVHQPVPQSRVAEPRPAQAPMVTRPAPQSRPAPVVEPRHQAAPAPAPKARPAPPAHPASKAEPHREPAPRPAPDEKHKSQ